MTLLDPCITRQNLVHLNDKPVKTVSEALRKRIMVNLQLGYLKV